VSEKDHPIEEAPMHKMGGTLTRGTSKKKKKKDKKKGKEPLEKYLDPRVAHKFLPSKKQQGAMKK